MNFVVKKKDLLGTVLFVPFLKTEIYKYMLPIVDIIFDCFMVAGFCYLMYLYVFSANRRNYDRKLELCGILFIIISLFSTVINDAELVYCIKAFFRIVAMYLYIEVIFIQRQCSVNCMYYPIMLLFVINILSYILYPNGMYSSIGANESFYSDENWILGGKNAYYYYLLFAIVLKLIRDDEDKTFCIDKIFYDMFFWTIVGVNLFIISGSMTSIVGIGMIMVYMLFNRFIIFQTKKYVYLYFIVSMIVFYILVLGSNSIFMEFISVATGKSVTFSGRTYIWEKSLAAIIDHIWLGRGFEEPLLTNTILGQVTSHNKYLWIIYRGGVLSGIAFLCFLSCCIKEIIKKYDYNIYKKFAFIFFSILICWMTECYDNNIFIVGVLVICTRYTPKKGV